MQIQTPRLTLEPISPLLAAAIVAGRQEPAGSWHPQYPLGEELDPLRSLADDPEPDPIFTMYLIRRKSDHLAIGGLGFFGPPGDLGEVDLGYGLVPAARGAGLATEAVLAAVQAAASHGARTIRADTDNANDASQRGVVQGAVHRHPSEFEQDIFRPPLRGEVVAPAVGFARSSPATPRLPQSARAVGRPGRPRASIEQREFRWHR